MECSWCTSGGSDGLPESWIRGFLETLTTAGSNDKGEVPGYEAAVQLCCSDLPALIQDGSASDGPPHRPCGPEGVERWTVPDATGSPLRLLGFYQASERKPDAHDPAGWYLGEGAFLSVWERTQDGRRLVVVPSDPRSSPAYYCGKPRANLTPHLMPCVIETSGHKIHTHGFPVPSAEKSTFSVWGAPTSLRVHAATAALAAARESPCCTVRVCPECRAALDASPHGTDMQKAILSAHASPGRLLQAQTGDMRILVPQDPHAGCLRHHSAAYEVRGARDQRTLIPPGALSASADTLFRLASHQYSDIEKALQAHGKYLRENDFDSVQKIAGLWLAACGSNRIQDGYASTFPFTPASSVQDLRESIKSNRPQEIADRLQMAFGRKVCDGGGVSTGECLFFLSDCETRGSVPWLHHLDMTSPPNAALAAKVLTSLADFSGAPQKALFFSIGAARLGMQPVGLPSAEAHYCDTFRAISTDPFFRLSAHLDHASVLLKTRAISGEPPMVDPDILVHHSRWFCSPRSDIPYREYAIRLVEDSRGTHGYSGEQANPAHIRHDHPVRRTTGLSWVDAVLEGMASLQAKRQQVDEGLQGLCALMKSETGEGLPLAMAAARGLGPDLIPEALRNELRQQYEEVSLANQESRKGLDVSGPSLGTAIRASQHYIALLAPGTGIRGRAVRDAIRSRGISL